MSAFNNFLQLVKVLIGWIYFMILQSPLQQHLLVIKQVVASEVIALEGVVELLLCSLRHGCHDHGVVQGVPGELEVSLCAHATNLLIFEVPSVHASQALTTAEGVTLYYGQVRGTVLYHGVLNIEASLEGPDQVAELDRWWPSPACRPICQARPG